MGRGLGEAWRSKPRQAYSLRGTRWPVLARAFRGESFDMPTRIHPEIHRALQGGLVIPACPLALNAQRKLDERRQRALFRYYLAAGAGGLAIGVHTTQFAIRDPKVSLFRPVLELGLEELRRSRSQAAQPDQSASRNPKSESVRTSAASAIGIAGVCGQTRQA